ncbi:MULTISPECIES: ABC transporter substrate-binding protein [Actinomycetes]|uniref:ABC transporter substrate-binding protein n=1 Tax=Actinomycetes TaxID=1760 RepID=UPI0009DD31B1|nr:MULTISPECIES: ABC transporter substrate-binding protein [Actinomycetes]
MSPNHRTVRAGLGAAALAAALLVAACSSDEGSGSDAVESAGADLTGAPVKVMTMAPLDNPVVVQPGVPAVAEAAAASINANGGINGGKLEVISCNELATPAGAQACAEQAVAEGVAAVVGSSSINGQTFYPIFEAAGIPVIGLTGPNSTDLTSPMSYPVSGTIVSQMVGAGVAAGQNGCKSLGIVATDIPTAQQAAGLVKLGFGSTGQSKVAVTPVPPSATDFAPVVASSTRDTDCITFVLNAQLTREYLTAFAQANKDQKVLGFGGSLSAANIEATGGADGPAEGGFLVTGGPIDSDPVWDAYRSAIETYVSNKEDLVAQGADFTGETEHTTWIAYQVFAEMAKGLPTVDAKAVVAKLNATSDLNVGGIAPVLEWAQPFANPQMPRLITRDVRFMTVKDGQIVPLDDKWHDMTPAFLGQQMPK